MKIFKLSQNKRLRANETEFYEDLINIGNGTTNDDNDEIQLPEHAITSDSLAKTVFKDVIDRKDWIELSKRSILCPYNKQVNDHNNETLDMLPGKSKIYYSRDTTDHGNEYASRPEFMNARESNDIPKHALELKENAIVILMRNIDVRRGLCNGTRIRVLNMLDHMIRGEIVNGSHKGKEVYIPRITITDDKNFSFNLYRQQFPVRLAFSMTINKAQGQTLKYIGLDLTSPVFAHGQLYVALSRVASWDDLKILLDGNNKLRKTKNVVYQEILDDVIIKRKNPLFMPFKPINIPININPPTTRSRETSPIRQRYHNRRKSTH
jgi:ATP-dependent DNA helicase PIF1